MVETTNIPARTSRTALAVAWIIVGMPLLWGVWETFKKSLALFH